jgi:hypothetical protein
MKPWRSCAAEVPLALLPPLTLAKLALGPLAALVGALAGAPTFNSWASTACAPEMLPIIVAFSCKNLPFRRTGAACELRPRQPIAAGPTPQGAVSRYNPLISMSTALHAGWGLASRNDSSSVRVQLQCQRTCAAAGL